MILPFATLWLLLLPPPAAATSIRAATTTCYANRAREHASAAVSGEQPAVAGVTASAGMRLLLDRGDLPAQFCVCL